MTVTAQTQVLALGCQAVKSDCQAARPPVNPAGVRGAPWTLALGQAGQLTARSTRRQRPRAVRDDFRG